MKQEKIYFLKQTRNHGLSNRPDSITIWKGKLENLKKAFGYTLECGVSWNSKINKKPKTINAFINALNKSYYETKLAGYSYTCIDLINESDMTSEMRVVEV